MCGRYFIDNDQSAEMAHISVAVSQKYPQLLLAKGEVFPSQIVPAIKAQADQLFLQPARWGFAKPYGTGLLINARSETITEKPTFRTPVRQNRLLVPATAFFEWHKADGSNRKYKFLAKAQGIFYMAAVARPAQKQGDPVDFVIVTTAATPPVSSIHDRMPVLIPKAQAKDYLNDYQAALLLLSQPVNISLVAQEII